MLQQSSTTVNTIRKIRKCVVSVLLCSILTAIAGCSRVPVVSTDPPKTSEFQAPVFTAVPSREAFQNPLTGFAMQADYVEAVADNTLVYIEVLWRDIEPSEGVYDFSALEKDKYLERWRREGKHAVLRFMCDDPTPEPHMDIPQWLYEKTGDGTHYAYDEDHQGYSPDYNNPLLIEAHARAIQALGEHFGQDGFVSYVELGSLGHWGEWHVNYQSGIVPMPKEPIREQYVIPYLTAFPNAKMLMRRPFNTAAKYGFGLYDDTAGHRRSTETWLEWIREGGDYHQADEKNALTPMPDAWKIAPMGGEFSSYLPLTEILSDRLAETVSLLKRSHTTFLGPHAPNGLREETGSECQDGIAAVRRAMGYRLWISRAECVYNTSEQSYDITLLWENDGNAPMYWDWPVFLYFYDSIGKLVGKWPVEVCLTQVLPGEQVPIALQVPETLVERADVITVGIEDPMTGKPAVRLAMDREQIHGTSVLWSVAEWHYG